MIKAQQWTFGSPGSSPLLIGMSFWAGPGIAPVSVHMALGALVALAFAWLAITARSTAFACRWPAWL